MIRKYEELSAGAWPAIHTKLYDGWLLRFSDGYTRRANAVFPLYESTIPIDEKIDYCEREYISRNLKPMFKVTLDSTPGDIDKKLEERGYTRDNEAALRVLDLNASGRYEINDVVIESQFSDRWLNGFLDCSGIKEQTVCLAARKILNNIPGKVVYVSKYIDGKLVACGYGAMERRYVGIFDILVQEDRRRKGYAKDILNGILGTACSAGIKKAYLQVSAGNIPAEKLYDKMGFKEIYRYWYRRNEKQD